MTERLMWAQCIVPVAEAVKPVLDARGCEGQQGEALPQP